MVFGPDVDVTGDVPYLGPDREECLDLYRPGTLFVSAPAVIVIHGGGFHGGDKADEREAGIARALAEKGYVCASINYALSTRENCWSAWPQNLRDCRSAVRYLRANADLYGVDPDSIGVIGASAGGYLALMLAHTAPRDGLHEPGPEADLSADVQAVVDMYGPTLFNGANSPVGSVPDEVDPETLSPLSYLASDGPPTLILHGTEDEVVPPEHSRQLADAARAAGLEHNLVFVDGAPHSFSLQPPQLELQSIVINFFNKHLRAD
ncbi:MAG: alpha/beta hydrolase [Candidatus Brocadiia bacterium]